MKKIALIALIMLPALCWGQDFIIPHDGNLINAYNINKRGEYVTYMRDTTHVGNVERIAMSDIFYLSVKENYAVDTSNYPAVADEDAVYDVLQRGKCVYVPTDSRNPFARAAQMVCKDMLQRWGYWTVVDTPRQAHFFLIFNFVNRGKDRAYIRLYSKAAYNSEQSAFESKHIAVMTQPTSENLVDNAQVAMDMMEKIMDEIVTEAGNEKSVLNRGTEFYVPANRNALEWFTYKVSK